MNKCALVPMKNSSAGKAFGEEVDTYPDMACAGGELGMVN